MNPRPTVICGATLIVTQLANFAAEGARSVAAQGFETAGTSNLF
jgi:hypothetical protein